MALLKLSEEVPLNDRIQVKCLPNEQSSTYPSLLDSFLDAYAVGWGKLSTGGLYSATLQDVSLEIYPSLGCFVVSEDKEKNWNSQICAGDFADSKDTCDGDSGGPLFIKKKINRKVKFVSVGIISYGVCFAENQPK